MKVWELIQELYKYGAGRDVTVSQKPLGYVVDIEMVEDEDGVVKIYGDGSLTPDGDEPD